MAADPQIVYRPSGKFPPYAPITVLGTGLVTGLIGGALYGILDWWVPFIYILVLATLGLGFGQALVLKWALRLFKVRNPAVAILCGLGCGLFAWYGAWVGWIFAGSDWDVLTFNPIDIYYIAQSVAETGTWGFSGDPVKGVMLYGVWLIEALIIIAPPVVIGSMLHRIAFNERVMSWADEEESLAPLAPVGAPEQAAIGAGLKRGDFSALQQLSPLGHESDSYTNITFAWADQDKETQYMSISSVTLSTDSKGNLKVKKKPFARHIIIDAESRALIEDIFSQRADGTPLAAAADGHPADDGDHVAQIEG